MKKFLLKSLFLLCALVVGSQCGWAENITYTLTITSINNINGGSGYAAYNGSRNMDAVCTTDPTKKYSVSLTTSNVMMTSGKIQFKKNTGYLYNSTNLGTITSVSVTYADDNQGTLTTWYGTTEHPSSGTTVGNGYFTIKETGNSYAGLAAEIVITFQFTIPTITFGNGNVLEGATLDLNSLFTSNSDGDVTYTITAGDSYGQIESDGHTLTGLAEGSVTVKASQAADGIYAAAEQTATIIVASASSPNVEITPSALAFGDVEVGQTKNMTFTITPANLTGNLAISCDNDKYTLSSSSIPQATTTAQTITVTAAPTALNDNMDGEVTISGGGIISQTVSLSATPYQVANVTLVAADNKGTFKQGDNVVTSINSRVGSSATVKAIPVDGYVFDSWSATGATPASSTDAETEFTFTSTSPTLTATFVVDPKVYFTLDGNDMQNMSNAGKTYGQSNLKTITVDGLHWEADAYQDGSNNITNMLQLRVRTNSKGVSYIKLPQFSGNIKKISFSVTGSSDSDTSLNGGNATATVLNFQTGNTSTETVVASSSSASSKSKEIDLSSIATDYTTGYITAGGGVRIWSLTVAIEPTDINVSVTSAKYATFSDHVARDFSTSGITVLKAVPDNNGKVDLEEITDGIVPANEGVVLFSDVVVNNAAIPATKATGAGDFSDNEMVANVVKTWITDDGGSSKVNYILSNGSNGVGFYKAKDTGANLAAHRAYLSTAATAGARDYLEFSFGETTGITKVGNTKQNVEGYYNLNGQRVAQPAKGLYIVNGKKVVIK